MADGSQGVPADQNYCEADHDRPHKSRNDDVIDVPSDVESELDKAVVSLDALSQDEFQYIVSNTRCRDILSDLLSTLILWMELVRWDRYSVLTTLSLTTNLRRIVLCTSCLVGRKKELTPPLPH